MNFLKEKFRYIFLQNKHNKFWRITATLLAAVVVFVTTYSLILPAITMELELVGEMPGVYLEEMEEFSEFQAGTANLLSDGSDVIPETYDDSLLYYDQNSKTDISGDDTVEENQSYEKLTALDENIETEVSYTSGALFSAGMQISVKELKKEAPEYSALYHIAQAKADQIPEETGHWSACDARIFDLRFINTDGYFEIPAGEMKAEFILHSPMLADHCKIILLNDVPDPFCADPDYIDYETITARINDTLEIDRNEYNEVTGFRFRAEAIRFVALMTRNDVTEDTAVTDQSMESVPGMQDADTAEIGSFDTETTVTETYEAEPDEILDGELTEISSTEAEETVDDETADAPAEDLQTAAVSEEVEITGNLPEDEVLTEEELAALYPAQIFDENTDTMSVHVEAETGAFPVDTTMTVEDIENEETISAIEGAVEQNVAKVHAVEITFRDAEDNEIEPLIPIKVVMTAEESAASEEVKVVHVDNEGVATQVENVSLVEENGEVQAEVVKEGNPEAAEAVEIPEAVETTEAAEIAEADETAETDGIPETIGFVQVAADTEDVSFMTDEFSIYALVYTVDFHYEVNGMVYDFSIPGGGFVSLEHLVEALGISAEDENGEIEEENQQNDDTDASYEAAIALNNITVSEAAKKFVAEVENVEFSDPELIWVGKIFSTFTVGDLKDANGLETEYSKDLTEEQIAEINAQTVEAGDWALISLHPFESEEMLTVTMKDGSRFTIKVTDYQIKKTAISAKGDTYEIIVTYGDNAQIPDGADLKVRVIEEQETEYAENVELTNAVLLSRDEDAVIHPVQFDISIVCGEDEIEPAKGSLVHVEARLVREAGVENADREILDDGEGSEDTEGIIMFQGAKIERSEEDARMIVAHIADDGSAEIIDDVSIDQDTSHVVLEFDTDSFSDYLFDTNTSMWNMPDTIYVGDEIYMWHQGDYWITNIGSIVTETKHNNSDSFKTVTAIAPGKFRIVHRNNWNNGNPYQNYKEITVLPARTGTNPPATIDTIDNASIGLTLNLFDYDLDSSLDSYFNNYNHGDHPVSQVFLNENNSINQNHALKFWGSGIGNNHGSYNEYNNTMISNIVYTNTTNGYPVLRTDNTSLDYLFTPSSGTDKTAYTNVNHLFKKEGDYYVYDSNVNYAYYDVSQGNGGDFAVYNNTYKQKSGGENGSIQNKAIGFFPFHPWDDQYDLYVNWNKNLNHHFGMSMSVDFSLPKDPKAVVDTEGNPIVFEFSGDDDLWVFIDGKLAMDIGGIHQPTSGTINFQDGTVTVKGSTEGSVETTQMNNATFTSRFPNLYDGNTHTMQVFYIERGGCDSNCKIKFNLTQYGHIHFDKVDEDNQNVKLKGAVFGIYKDQECTQPLMENLKDGTSRAYIAESDANGRVTFSDIPLGDYYLKELNPPEGYPLDSTVHSVRVFLDTTTGQIRVVASINGINVENPGVKITNKKPAPINLGLMKEWKNQNGETIPAPENVSAVFELKRIRTYETYTEEVVEGTGRDVSHLKVGWIHKGEIHDYAEYDLVSNTQATVSWQYVNGYTGSKDCIVDGTRIDKDYVSGNVVSQALIMPAEGQTATFYIVDESDNGEAISGINVAGDQFFGNSGGGVIHHFKTTTEPDPDFHYSGEYVTNNQVTLPIGENTWGYDFVNLPLVGESEDGNTVYNYTYYLEEFSNVSPEGTTIVYKDLAGNLIPSALDAETSQSGTLSVTNKVNLGALELTKKVTVNGNNTVDPRISATVSFTIEGVEGTFTESISHEVEITYVEGVVKKYKVDSTVTEVTDGGNTQSVLVDALVPGDYRITETGSGSLKFKSVSGGNNDGNETEKSITVKVTPGKNLAATLENTAKTTFTNDFETIPVTATKSWSDLSPGKVHPTIYYRLYYRTANGDIAVPGEKLKPLPNGTTSVTWQNIPKYDDNGQEYVYLVKEYIQKEDGEFVEDEVHYTEAAPNGYVVEENGLSLTNTESDKYDPRTAYTGRKVWIDTANNGATRPENLTVKLMIDKTGNGPSADDVEAVNASGAPYTIDWQKNGNEWTYSFHNLPVYDADENIVRYYAVETPVNGYEQSDAVITATQYAYKTSFEAQRIENDATIPLSSEIHKLPFVAIKINAYGKQYHIWTVRRATPEEETTLIGIFNQYLGRSEANSGNTRFVSGLPVSKAADGNVEYLYKPQPDGYKISISKSSGDLVNVAVDNHGAFAYILTGTMEYDYNSGSTELTNTLRTEDYSVHKTWGEGQNPPEGAVIKITLAATVCGTVTDENPEPESVEKDLDSLGIGKTEIILNGGLEGGDDTAAKPWEYKWLNLPQYDEDGNKITYTASETEYTINGKPVDLTGMTTDTEDENYDVVFTNVIPSTEISAKKNWPEGQTVPEGTIVTLAITAKLENGSDPNGVTVTPLSVQLDGKVTAGDDTEVETADTLWRYTWTDLPEYDKDGKKIIYTVAETEYKIGGISYEDLIPAANDPAEEGIDFSFTNELPVTSVTVNKTWSTMSGASTDWPEGISVIMTLRGRVPGQEGGELIPLETLVIPDIAVGEETVPQTVNYPLTSTETSHTWQNLPMYTLDGQPITYTADETGMTYTPQGGEPISIQNWAQSIDIGKDQNGNVVTIDNTPFETEISLTKVWTLNGNPKEMEEETSIKFDLFQTDVESALDLSSNGYTVNRGTATRNRILYVTGDTPGWQVVTISNLPKYQLAFTTTEEGDTTAYYTGITYYAVEDGVQGHTRISYSLPAQNHGTGGVTPGEEEETGPTDTTVPAGSAVNSGLITIFNRDTDVDIKVLKVDETYAGKHLPNAEFQILKWNEDRSMYLAYNLETMDYATQEEEAKSKLLTGSEGMLTFEGLLDGKYKIVETKSPTGYIKTVDNDIIFRIDDGVVKWTDEEDAEIGADNKPDQLEYEDLMFTVENTRGPALPATGGPGTGMLYLIGCLLTLCAGSTLFIRYRKRAV